MQGLLPQTPLDLDSTIAILPSVPSVDKDRVGDPRQLLLQPHPAPAPFPLWVYLSSCFLFRSGVQKNNKPRCGSRRKQNWQAGSCLISHRPGGTAYLSLLGPGRRTLRFWFCCPQRPVQPINSGSGKSQASSGPSKGRGQPSLIRVLKMFLRKPIQMSSALQGRAGIIIIKQRLHGDFIFKALWGWLGRGGSGVAQRIPSWEVIPSPPTSLGLVPPASQPSL